jgi:hypothetical protein
LVVLWGDSDGTLTVQPRGDALGAYFRTTEISDVFVYDDDRHSMLGAFERLSGDFVLEDFKGRCFAASPPLAIR